MEKFGHCGTCKHWRPKAPSDTGSDEHTFLNELAERIQPHQLGLCNAIAALPEAITLKVDVNAPAYTIDKELHCSSLVTRAHFGCTLYERGETIKADAPKPLKIRNLTLTERITLFAEKRNMLVSAAATMIRFNTNVHKDKELDESMDSPQHQFLDYHDIPRSEVQDGD